MEVKVVVVVVTVTVTVVTVTVTVVTISFWRAGPRPPPPIKVKSKVTHFGGGVFHFFAVFGPNGKRGTTSPENFSIERPIFVASPPPPSPNGGTQTFYPAFQAISNLHFFSHHNIFSEI